MQRLAAYTKALRRTYPQHPLYYQLVTQYSNGVICIFMRPETNEVSNNLVYAARCSVHQKYFAWVTASLFNNNQLVARLLRENTVQIYAVAIGKNNGASTLIIATKRELAPFSCNKERTGPIFLPFFYQKQRFKANHPPFFCAILT